MKKHPDNANEALVDHLTRQQSSLFHYILSLVPDPVSAQDILQETNLVLWRKAAEYDSALPFMPWACRIALYQVKAHRRDQARDLHVFDDDVLDQLAAEPPEAHIGRPLEQGLRDCLERLPGKQRELIIARYQPGASVESLALASKLSPNALSQALFRIRSALADCLERQQQTS
jgi:RNA polymerase sigma-70 factor (ECF subfamily)